MTFFTTVDRSKISLELEVAEVIGFHDPVIFLLTEYYLLFFLTYRRPKLSIEIRFHIYQPMLYQINVNIPNQSTPCWLKSFGRIPEWFSN